MPSSQLRRREAGDRVTGQLNMQGQFMGRQGPGDQPESRWSSVIPRFMEGLQVLALQEAGSEPPNGAGWQVENFQGAGVTEHTYQLQGGGGSNVVNIYWAGPGQQRNGLAIVTRESANDVVQLPVPSGHNSRPIMGIRLGNEWYFTGHAHVGGADAVDLYETARQYMEREGVPGTNWRILGDFNTDPALMPARLQNRIIAAGQPTHQGGSELDFAMEGAPTTRTQRGTLRGWNSDHFGMVIPFIGLMIDNQGCRRRTLKCEAPMPGHTYRFFSVQQPNEVISCNGVTGSLPALRYYDPRAFAEITEDAGYMVQVRFSAEHDEYLLAFGDSNDAVCIQRDGEEIKAAACDPTNRDQRWKLDGNRQIQDPGGKRYLAVGQDNYLYMSDSAYDWQHKALDYVPPRTEFRRRGGAWSGEQPPEEDIGSVEEDTESSLGGASTDESSRTASWKPLLRPGQGPQGPGAWSDTSDQE